MLTTREFLASLEFPVCCYCGKVRAIHRDHVVSRAIRRRHHIAANDVRFHVPACGPCNWRKGTSRFYPAGFDISILPGDPKKWREWDGGALRAA